MDDSNIIEEQLLELCASEELKGEVQILRDKEKTLKREVERYRETTRALEEALEEAVKSNGKQITPKKDQVHPSYENSDEVNSNDDILYIRNPETEPLIAEIVALKKKIKELQSEGFDIGEQTKDTHNKKGDSVEVTIHDF